MSWEGVPIDCECGGFDDRHRSDCKNRDNWPHLKNAPPPTSVKREHPDALTLDQLFAHVDELERTRDFFADELWKVKPGDDPGDPSYLCLVAPETGYELYPIQLYPMSAKQALRWIAQIAGKAWSSDRVIASLVRCLDEIYDLQKVAHSAKPRDPKLNLVPEGLLQS